MMNWPCWRTWSDIQWKRIFMAVDTVAEANYQRRQQRPSAGSRDQCAFNGFLSFNSRPLGFTDRAGDYIRAARNDIHQAIGRRIVLVTRWPNVLQGTKLRTRTRQHHRKVPIMYYKMRWSARKGGGRSVGYSEHWQHTRIPCILKSIQVTFDKSDQDDGSLCLVVYIIMQIHECITSSVWSRVTVCTCLVCQKMVMCYKRENCHRCKVIELQLHTRSDS